MDLAEVVRCILVGGPPAVRPKKGLTLVAPNIYKILVNETTKLYESEYDAIRALSNGDPVPLDFFKSKTETINTNQFYVPKYTSEYESDYTNSLDYNSSFNDINNFTNNDLIIDQLDMIKAQLSLLVSIKIIPSGNDVTKLPNLPYWPVSNEYEFRELCLSRWGLYDQLLTDIPNLLKETQYCEKIWDSCDSIYELEKALEEISDIQNKIQQQQIIENKDDKIKRNIWQNLPNIDKHCVVDYEDIEESRPILCLKAKSIKKKKADINLPLYNLNTTNLCTVVAKQYDSYHQFMLASMYKKNETITDVKTIINYMHTELNYQNCSKVIFLTKSNEDLKIKPSTLIDTAYCSICKKVTVQKRCAVLYIKKCSVCDIKSNYWLPTNDMILKLIAGLRESEQNKISLAIYDDIISDSLNYTEPRELINSNYHVNIDKNVNRSSLYKNSFFELLQQKPKHNLDIVNCYDQIPIALLMSNISTKIDNMKSRYLLETEQFQNSILESISLNEENNYIHYLNGIKYKLQSVQTKQNNININQLLELVYEFGSNNKAHAVQFHEIIKNFMPKFINDNIKSATELLPSSTKTLIEKPAQWLGIYTSDIFSNSKIESNESENLDKLEANVDGKINNISSCINNDLNKFEKFSTNDLNICQNLSTNDLNICQNFSNDITHSNIYKSEEQKIFSFSDLETLNLEDSSGDIKTLNNNESMAFENNINLDDDSIISKYSSSIDNDHIETSSSSFRRLHTPYKYNTSIYEINPKLSYVNENHDISSFTDTSTLIKNKDNIISLFEVSKTGIIISNIVILFSNITFISDIASKVFLRYLTETNLLINELSCEMKEMFTFIFEFCFPNSGISLLDIIIANDDLTNNQLFICMKAIELQKNIALYRFMKSENKLFDISLNSGKNIVTDSMINCSNCNKKKNLYDVCNNKLEQKNIDKKEELSKNSVNEDREGLNKVKIISNEKNIESDKIISDSLQNSFSHDLNNSLLKLKAVSFKLQLNSYNSDINDYNISNINDYNISNINDIHHDISNYSCNLELDQFVKANDPSTQLVSNENTTNIRSVNNILWNLENKSGHISNNLKIKNSNLYVSDTNINFPLLVQNCDNKIKEDSLDFETYSNPLVYGSNSYVFKTDFNQEHKYDSDYIEYNTNDKDNKHYSTDFNIVKDVYGGIRSLTKNNLNNIDGKHYSKRQSTNIISDEIFYKYCPNKSIILEYRNFIRRFVSQNDYLTLNNYSSEALESIIEDYLEIESTDMRNMNFDLSKSTMNNKEKVFFNTISSIADAARSSLRDRNLKNSYLEYLTSRLNAFNSSIKDHINSCLTCKISEEPTNICLSCLDIIDSNAVKCEKCNSTYHSRCTRALGYLCSQCSACL